MTVFLNPVSVFGGLSGLLSLVIRPIVENKQALCKQLLKNLICLMAEKYK